MKCYFLGLAPAILHHDSHLLTKEFESNPCISFHVEVQAQENGHSRETLCSGIRQKTQPPAVLIRCPPAFALPQ